MMVMWWFAAELLNKGSCCSSMGQRIQSIRAQKSKIFSESLQNPPVMPIGWLIWCVIYESDWRLNRAMVAPMDRKGLDLIKI
jgi:hypothetical protein